MTRFASALVALALAVPTGALAATPPEGPFGLGLGGGFGVSGLSGKLYLGDASALQGVVGAYGWGYNGHSGIGFGLDYLVERPSFASVEPVEFGWNYGLGGSIAVWDTVHEDDELRVGASGVLGLEILLQPVPIDLVLEYRPGVIIIPAFDLALINFSGHIRYYF